MDARAVFAKKTYTEARLEKRLKLLALLIPVNGIEMQIHTRLTLPNPQSVLGACV